MLRDAVRRANEALDWIEERQGPLPPTNYARIETDVRTVRAMSEQADDARVSEIRECMNRVLRETPAADLPVAMAGDTLFLLNRLDALTAERDESVANMTATAAAFARLKANSEAWHDDSKRLHNEYMPTAAIMDEVLATRDRAITEAWAERDAARAWSARWKDFARGLRRAARQHYESWQRACDDVSRLSADLDRTEAERDALRARAERAEAALRHVYGYAAAIQRLTAFSQIGFRCSLIRETVSRALPDDEAKRLHAETEIILDEFMGRAALAAASEGEG